MNIACLHNFLWRNPDSAAIYTPPGTFDYEENGRVIEGEPWVMEIGLLFFLFERLHVNQLWRRKK